MSQNLFDIQNGIISLVVELEELTAYLQENSHDVLAMSRLNELSALLDADMIHLESKSDAYGAIIKRLELQEKENRDMAAIYSVKARQRVSAQNRLRSRISQVMQTLQIEKIKGTTFNISLNKTSYAVVVDDVPQELIDGLPPYLKKVKPEIDKTNLKSALLDGEYFEWARLTENRTITIR